MIQALYTYDNWESVTQEVLGMPAEEFEAGWFDYLEERFGYD